MSDIHFTEEEFKEFDRLTRNASCSDQVIRINGRLDLRQFREKHGKAKCDAMWARITASEKNLKLARAH